MKRLWMLTGMLCLAMACSAALAQEDAATTEKPAKAAKKPKLKGIYAIMAAQLQLTDEQIAKIQEKVADREKALADWDASEKGKKLAELKTKVADARKEKNKEQVKTLSAEMRPLAEERAKLEAQKITEIESILTPEQLAQWQELSVYTAVMRRFAKLTLTPEQKTAIRAEVKTAAPEIAKIAPDAKSEKMRAYSKLINAISEKILTPEQREQLQKKAAPKAEAPAEKAE